MKERETKLKRLREIPARELRIWMGLLGYCRARGLGGVIRGFGEWTLSRQRKELGVRLIGSRSRHGLWVKRGRDLWVLEWEEYWGGKGVRDSVNGNATTCATTFATSHATQVLLGNYESFTNIGTSMGNVGNPGGELGATTFATTCATTFATIGKNGEDLFTDDGSVTDERVLGIPGGNGRNCMVMKANCEKIVGVAVNSMQSSDKENSGKNPPPLNNPPPKGYGNTKIHGKAKVYPLIPKPLEPLSPSPQRSFPRKGPEGGSQMVWKDTAWGPDGEDLTYEAVMEFVKRWPGELSSGTPKIPENFAIQWLQKAARRTGRWLNWQRVLVADWRAEHRGISWNWRGAEAPVEQGGVKLGVNPVARQLALERQLERVTAEINRHPANSLSTNYRMDYTPEEKRKLEELCRRRKQIEEALLNMEL